MMKRVSRTILALLFAFGLSLGAAQTAQAQQAPSAASVQDTVGFDLYRATAVTAGVVGGAVVATALTNGLILPAYAVLTGAEMAGMGFFGPQAGYAFFRGGMRLLGAVSGGLYADEWYMGQ